MRKVATEKLDIAAKPEMFTIRSGPPDSYFSLFKMWKVKPAVKPRE